MSLREELTTRYGPLPGWAWLLGAWGGGLMPTAVGATVVVLALPMLDHAGPTDQTPGIAPTVATPQPAVVAPIPSPSPVAEKEPELPLTSMDAIAAAYRADPNAADVRYKGKRVRTEIVVRKSGVGWVGTVVTLRDSAPRSVSI